MEQKSTDRGRSPNVKVRKPKSPRARSPKSRRKLTPPRAMILPPSSHPARSKSRSKSPRPKAKKKPRRRSTPSLLSLLPDAAEKKTNANGTGDDGTTKQDPPTGQKTSLSVIVVGHVDAGKSTTSGHLLYLGTPSCRCVVVWLLSDSICDAIFQVVVWRLVSLLLMRQKART